MSILDACRSGDLSLVEDLLLAQGANVHEKDEDDNTPILVASENGHLSIVELLLYNGANLHLIN